MDLRGVVGDEGGYAPSLPANAAAVDIVLEAIGRAGYQADERIAIALDLAANESTATAVTLSAATTAT